MKMALQIDAGFVVLREEVTNMLTSVAAVVLGKAPPEEFERGFQWVAWVLTFAAVGLLLTVMQQAGLVPKLSESNLEPDEPEDYFEDFHSKLIHDDRKSTAELRTIKKEAKSFQDFPSQQTQKAIRERAATPVQQLTKSDQSLLGSSNKIERKAENQQSRSHPYVSSDLDYGRLIDNGRVGRTRADGTSKSRSTKSVHVYYMEESLLDRKAS